MAVVVLACLFLFAGCICMTPQRHRGELKLAEMCGRLDVLSELHKEKTKKKDSDYYWEKWKEKLLEELIPKTKKE